MTIRWKENPELPPLLVKGRDVNWPRIKWLWCQPESEPPKEYRDLYLGWFALEELTATGGLDEIKQAAASAPVRAFPGPHGNGR